MKPHIISDIDGTLTKEPEFIGFEVKPNECVIDYLQKQSKNGTKITYVSARDEFLRKLTMRWFEKHNVPNADMLLDVHSGERRGTEVIPELCKPDENCIYFDDNRDARVSAKKILGDRITIIDPLDCNNIPE